MKKFSIAALCAIANFTWIYGVTFYTPRAMLFSLVWCAFLAGYLNDNAPNRSGSEYSQYMHVTYGKFIRYVNLVCFIVYILALCCYDSISRHASSARTNQFRRNQYASNVTTQVINTRDYIAADAATNEPLNSTCEVSMLNTDDSKSLIMTVDWTTQRRFLKFISITC